MPEEDNNGSRNDTKLQFISPKAKEPLELLFSLQKSKRNYGCFSSLM